NGQHPGQDSDMVDGSRRGPGGRRGSVVGRDIIGWCVISRAGSFWSTGKTAVLGSHTTGTGRPSTGQRSGVGYCHADIACCTCRIDVSSPTMASIGLQPGVDGVHQCSTVQFAVTE